MIRTLEFIDWNKFLEEKNEHITLVLDFEIDAGFSFTNAVALRKMYKTNSAVPLDGSLCVPSKLLRFTNLVFSDTIVLHSVTIESNDFQKIETTERYTLSANFSPCSIDYELISLELSRLIERKGGSSKENIIMLYMVSYFQSLANIVKNNIISFVGLSGFFTKFVSGSYNLYFIKDGKPYRIVQESGGEETAGHNPVHPNSLVASIIQKKYEAQSNIPSNVKTYLIKGLHYKFLGFYDESFITYYKIVETIFKGSVFPSILAQEIFGCDDKKLIATLKNSNQKTMMLFIFQWLVFNEFLEKNNESRKDLMDKLLAASQLRNDISHSVDQSEESKKQLPFIILLSCVLIESTMTHHQPIKVMKTE
ncbi:hypothetical protein [Klebsiella michiganensis]|uniref:hypothetical protein n=1 Tax=Klebsiella michiganensis TaxID=1134687 RepID=UPI000EFC9050|nr:hypothetical protein [Klebsiella michiganensis]RMC66795.1 hypothetical protein EBH72_33165 [Klebsiella michiganensis]HBS3078662.1 hypothetical protein [Klebsiella variicola subsp. variicola]